MVESRLVRQRQRSEDDAESADAFIERLRYGVRGGVVATIVMTLFRLPTSRSLPPTANFWSKFLGDGDPEDYPVVGLALHLLYGVGGGVAFGLIAPGRSDDDAMAETKNALVGTLFGSLLSLFGISVVLGKLLDMSLEADERIVFHISHVIYGLTLGTWVGSRFGGED
jgi:hypothetical protein